MPRQALLTRVAQARKASPYNGNGGTTAPRSAQNNIGLSRAQPASRNQTGVGPGHPAQKQPAPPAANPQGPPPTTSSAPAGKPWDSQAENAWGSGEHSYNDRMAELEGGWKAREDYYGLGATKNPYSQAALLERRHEIDRRTNTNAAGLSIYSGSLINAQAGADRNYDVNLEGLTAAFTAEHEQNEREKEKAKHIWEAQQAEINQEAAERAEETEPAPAPGPEEGGGSGPAKKGKGGGKKGGGGKGKGGGSGSGGTTAPGGKGKGKGK